MIFHEPTTQAVVLTDANGCNYQDMLRLEVIPQSECLTDVDEFGTTDITLSPNPVSSTLTINLNGLTTADAIIYDAGGKLIDSMKNITDGESVDVSALNDGLYLMVLSNGTQRQTHRFVKQ